MTDDEKRSQVVAQCNAVHKLASDLARLHADYAGLIESGESDQILDHVGQRTAALMETLGDILNGIDAVSEDDDWLNPIFEEAQRRWPTASPQRPNETKEGN